MSHTLNLLNSYFLYFELFFLFSNHLEALFFQEFHPL
nr:MAG TPA: hypothetical protein [Caudoviricetes sp.]